MFDFRSLMVGILFLLSLMYTVQRLQNIRQIKSYLNQYPLLARQIHIPPTSLLYLRLIISVFVPILILFALHDPYHEPGEKVPVVTGGVDLLFLVDVSLSMNATDLKPDRMTVFRDAILSSLPTLEGNRLGIIAFAGSAFLYSPLTTDIIAFRDYVLAMNTDLILDNGTNLEKGLALTKKILESGKVYRNRLVVLVSDGENQKGDIDIDLPAQLVVVGAGTEKGGPIYYSSSQASGYVKRDTSLSPDPRSEGIIISKRNSKILQEIAANNNGKYIDLDRHLGKNLADEIDKMKKNETLKMSTAMESMNHYFLIIALVLLFIDYTLIEYLVRRSDP